MDLQLRRPLIPFLFSFTGGVLFAHHFLCSCQWVIFPILLCTAACLLVVISALDRFKLSFLLMTFLITGMLLDLHQHRPSQLHPLASKSKKVTIEGTLLEPVKSIKDTAKLNIRAHRLFSGENVLSLNDNLVITVYNHIPDLRPGEKMRFPARLKAFKNFNNPGRYDYEEAMKIKGFTCAAHVSDGRYIVPMGPGHLPLHRRMLEKVRRPVREFFEENLSARENALYSAIILGDQQKINSDLRESFNRTGLGHVLAVSGLHIGLVAWVVFFLLKRGLSRSYTLTLKTDIRKLTALLTCIPVLGYTLIAGFQVSSQRAMIMVLTFLWSLILGREKEVWSTLALAGLIILAIEPHAILSMSFQLSFSAMIGIPWLTPSILNIFPGPEDTKQKTIYAQVYAYFIGLVAVCISATIFLLPLLLYFFHRIPVITVPANLLIVPILGLWVIPTGLLSAVILPFSFEAANIFLQLGARGLNVMMGIIRFGLIFPGAVSGWPYRTPLR